MVKTLQLKLVLLLCMIMGAGTAWATDVTYSLTPDQTSTGSNATAYITTLTEFTYDGISWKMNQWNPKTLQVKTNQSSASSEFRFYNTSAFAGRIKQVVITFSALTVSDASKLMFLGGTSEVSATTGGTAGTWNATAKTLTWTPGTSDNFTYFAFYQNGKAASGTNYLASSDAIVVTYESSGGSTTEKVVTPSFDPVAGTYTTPQSVTLATTTSGATIHYTTDGSAPTASSPTYSSTAIAVNTSMTIKALAVKSGMDDSDVATAVYVIKPATPSIALAGLNASITCETANTTIYYTTDGSDPDDNSTEYTSSFAVTKGQTVKAIAYDNYDNASDIKTLVVPSVVPNPKNIGSNYYVKVTNVSALEDGDAILIVHEGSTSAMSTNQASNNRPKASILNYLDATEGIIDGLADGVQKIVLVKDGDDCYFYTGSLGYLYAAGANSNNYLRTETEPDNNDNAKAAISITNGDASIVFQGNSSRNHLRFNDNTNQYLFSCYASTSTLPLVQIYKEVDNTLPSITAADVDIAYDATNGSITYTLNNEVSGGTMSANTTSDWLTVGTPSNGSVALTCNANSAYTARTATVTLTYTYNTNETVTKTVTVTQAAAPKPTITASDVNIEYNDESGSITYSLANATGNVSAVVTDGNWLTLGTVTNSTVPFTCSANTAAAARTATVTLSFTGADNKVVTITQAGNPDGDVSTISAITAAGNYAVKGTIVAISSRGFVLGDGTGYIYYYEGSSFTPAYYNIGDKKKLSGSVTENTNNKILQFGSGTTITTVTESNYADENPTVLSGSDMDTRVGSSTATLSSYVQYEGTLTISGTYYNITSIDGANTAKGSISFPTSTEFTSLDGKVVKVTGYFVGVSSSQYYNTMLGSIEEVTDPVINASDVNLAYDATSGEIGYTITNPTTGTSLNASITNGSDWISNIEVDADKVTFTTTANTGATDRTGTITLTYSGATNKVITVTQGHQVVDYATLPFHYDGNGSMAGNVTGLTESGLGAYSSAPMIKFDDSNDYLVLKMNEAPAYLAFDVKCYQSNNTWEGTFKVQTSADGATYTDLAVYSEQSNALTTNVETKTFKTFDSNVRYIKWIYTKTKGNVALGNIRVNCESFTIKANFPATTFSSDMKLDFGNIESVTDGTTATAYIIKDGNGTTEAAPSIVPASTGLYIEGDAGSYYVPVTTETASTINGNKLVATTAGETYNSNSTTTYYAYGHYTGNSEDKYAFMKIGGAGLTPGAGKALLCITGGGAKDIIDVNGGATAIDNLQWTIDNSGANGIYDLQGRRVAQPTKGIYIVNGRKVVIK